MAILLQLQDITKSYGTRLLFDAATVSMADGQKIGFIGANGSGKTTLLRMILGQEDVDKGKVIKFEKTRLGYLEQQEIIDPNETVMAYLERVSGRESWECAKAAGSFDLKNERLEAPFGSLSGGCQMRVRLAGMFAREPNFVLLDEPTNYLDLQTVLLLENVLRTFRGAVLLVSHDREFLKNVCTHTLELEHEKLTLFSGDIEAYLQYKEERLEEEKRFNKKVAAQRKHLQVFVDRFRYKAALAAQAQSKLKQISRLKSIDIAHSIRTVHLNIQANPQRKATAIDCQDLTIGYGSTKPVISSINVETERGEHIALLGENGQGKSTFLKTIAAELPALAGKFKWGHGLRIAYYAQHVPQMLPKHGTAESYLKSCAPSMPMEDIWHNAGNFLFTKDDLSKPISVLSGGERARLCLAGICLSRYDVLLLDEPTNHLDFNTVEALAEALEEYPGTIIFVSHSRTFTAQLATKIWEMKNGRLREYPWPYEMYVHELKEEEDLDVTQDEVSEIPARSQAVVYQELKREKRANARLEQGMEKLKNEQQNIFDWYEMNPLDKDPEKRRKLDEIQAALQEQEKEWYSSLERIESLKNEQRVQ